jgi:hypothetical protein
MTVVKSKEVKTGWSNSRHTWQNHVRNSMAKRDCFADDDDDDDDNDNDGDDSDEEITRSDIDSD